jgi:hypothetical protein
VMKTLQGPQYNAWAIFPRDMDDNCYPLQSAFDGANAAKGAITWLGRIPTQAKRPGGYVVKYNGQAHLNVIVNYGTGGTQFLSDTLVSGGTDIRGVALPNNAPGGDQDCVLLVQLFDVGPAGFNNLRICHVDDEALLDAGVIWHPIYISVMNLFRPHSIRMMNWQYGNQCNMTKFSQRRHNAMSSWNNYRLIPALDFGFTTHVGRDYSITTTMGARTHGEMLHCNFDHGWERKACTVSAASPALVTVPGGHSFLAGERIRFSASDSVGPNLSTTAVYHILPTGLDATHFQFSTTAGGAAFSNVGDTTSSGLSFERVFDRACTISAANPMVVTCPDGHDYAAGDWVAFNGGIGPNLSGYIPYRVLATGLTGTQFRVSLTEGGTPISNVGDTTSNNMTVTRSPTLNRDGLGRVPIIDEYGGAHLHQGPSRNADRQYLSTLTYDAATNTYTLFGNGRWDLGFGGDQGLTDGSVPLDAFLDLCATVGAHPMLSGYIDGTYPSTGLHGEMAQYCKDWIAANNVPWMKVRQEGGNEIWNWPIFGLTTTSRYIAKNSRRIGGPSFDYHDPYGWAMTEIGQEVSGVFGGDRSKFDVICGVQTVGNPAQFQKRLNSDEWMAQATAPAGYVKQPAKNYVTQVTTAQYFTPPEDAGVETMQEHYTDGDTSQLGLYLDKLMTASAPFNIAYVNQAHLNYKQWCIDNGIPGMTGYEGGYSPDYNPGMSTYTLKRDAKQYTTPSELLPGGIYHAIQRVFDNFWRMTVPGFTAEAPSVFQLEGINPSNNAWSIQEGILDPPSEQLKCYALMNRGKRRYTARAS